MIQSMPKMPKILSRLSVILLIALIITGCGVNGYKTPDSVTVYNISGTVTNDATPAQPMAGIIIKINGNDAATTDADGKWSVLGLSGSVTVSAEGAGYTFTPDNRVISGSNTHVDFVGTTTPYTASGRVKDNNDNPLEGVSISFNGGGTVLTDANGYWTKPRLGGRVTVEPALEGYTFMPATQQITVLNASNIDFTGTPEDQFDASVLITKGNVGPGGLTGVTIHCEYSNGTVSDVQTDSNGQWTKKLGKSKTVTITLSKPGWEFTPATFTLSDPSPSASSTANRVSYTGQQILSAIVANATIRSTTGGTQMPTALTIDGDTVPMASVVYLMAKWIALFNNGTSVNGAIPGQVPYLAVAKPDSFTPGKVTGYIFFGGGTDGFYGASKSLVEAIETSPAPKLPDDFLFNNAWNSSGNIGDAKTTEHVHAPDVINILARAINWVNSNPGVLPNNVSLKSPGMGKPSGW
jgi:hypothetical protein